MAGLVGIGLSDLWAASGLEGPEFAGEEVRSRTLALKHNNVQDFWAASGLENQEFAGEGVRARPSALNVNFATRREAMSVAGNFCV